MDRSGSEITALAVTVVAGSLLSTNNRIVSVRFTSISNGTVEIGGRQFAVPGTYTLPSPSALWAFTVRKSVRGPSTTVSYVVRDRCGDVPQFAGMGPGFGGPAPTSMPTPGTPTATPTNTPAPTATPVVTATPTNTPGQPGGAGQPCPQSLHDAIVTRGPDGKMYPTWHPPVDPVTGCAFGHEHGADPRTSQANSELPPFGYVTAVAGLANEPHEGFKVFLVHAGTIFEQQPAVADMRLVFHMGTSRVGRYTNQFHSMMYDYVARDGSGRSAHVQGMGNTGVPVGSTCSSPRQGGRDFSTVGCNDSYEIWGYRFQVVHPDDAFTGVDQVRFTAAGGVAAFDPITTRDPADNTRLLYTEQYRNGPSAADPLSPNARYRGCDREAYIQPFWNNAQGRPTVYWTDVYGQVNRAGEAPGLLRQEVSTAPKSTIDVFKYRQTFCHPTVHAPN